jgi:hypothetical protein
MQSIEIARALGETGNLLDIRGRPVPRPRLTQPLAEMVAHGEDLDQLPGQTAELSDRFTSTVAAGRGQGGYQHG